MQTQLYHWSKQQSKRILQIDFFRFCVVGGIGFCVSMASLYLFKGVLGLPLWVSYVASNEIGLMSNFIFHEKWTYKKNDHHTKSLWVKFWHFHLSSWSGIVIIVVIGLVSVHVLHVSPYIGQAIGSGVAMFWNFFWTKYYIFTGKSPKPLGHPEELAEE